MIINEMTITEKSMEAKVQVTKTKEEEVEVDHHTTIATISKEETVNCLTLEISVNVETAEIGNREFRNRKASGA